MSASEKSTKRRNKSRCNVRGCDRQINIPVHSLPSTSYAKMRNLWLKRLQLSASSASLNRNRYYVCGNHFRPEDYKEYSSTALRRKLKRTAVPSLNLPPSSYASIDDELKLTMKAFANNELDVQVNYSSKRQPLPQHEIREMSCDNELPVQVNGVYKRQPLSELVEVSSGDETNDEYILGL